MAATGRILFIAGHDADFLQDTVLSGLVKRLGHHRVYDWPFSPRLYLRNHAYPKRMVRRSRLSLWGRFRSGGDPAEFAAVVLGSCKPSTFHAWLRIAHSIPSHVPVLFIDGGDRTPIGGDLDRLGAAGLLAQAEAVRRIDLVLKRETPCGHDFGRPTIPFTFGINPDYLPSHRPAPAFDVACWCVESHPLRSRALDLLAGRFDCDANGSRRGQDVRAYRRLGRTGEAYLAELARCRIVVSLPGGGWDCLRYWEAPAVGACMVTPRPLIEIPDDFVVGSEVVHCADDCSDLIEVCAALLADPARRERIAAAGQAKALARHTDTARADRLLAALAERCGVELRDQ